jgi:hypothetical protein
MEKGDIALYLKNAIFPFFFMRSAKSAMSPFVFCPFLFACLCASGRRWPARSVTLRPWYFDHQVGPPPGLTLFKRETYHEVRDGPGWRLEIFRGR